MTAETRLNRVTVGLVLAFALVTSHAQESSQGEENTNVSGKPTAEQIAIWAGEVLDRQIQAEKHLRAPKRVRAAARCVGVFPKVVKAGILIAAQEGAGLVACRDPETSKWNSPAYFKFGAASIGIQAGVQTATIILQFMSEASVDALIDGKIKLGAGISIAAGPVGVQTTTEDWSKVDVVSYVSSKGLFAGVDLSGGGISFDDKTTQAVYGKPMGGEAALFAYKQTPAVLQAYHRKLSAFSPPKAATTQ